MASALRSWAGAVFLEERAGGRDFAAGVANAMETANNDSRAKSLFMDNIFRLHCIVSAEPCLGGILSRPALYSVKYYFTTSTPANHARPTCRRFAARRLLLKIFTHLRTRGARSNPEGP